MNKRIARSLFVACSLTATLLVPIIGEAASACAASRNNLYLAGFFDGQGGMASDFYVAGEEASSVTTTVRVVPGDCWAEVVEGDYGTADGSALAGQDYQATSGWTDYLCDSSPHEQEYCPPGVDFQHQAQVPIIDDPDDEAAVETFLFRLTRSSSGMADPSSAPIHIVDNDGLLRFSLEPTLNGAAAMPYERSESFPSFRIPVFRAGPAGGAASVTYVLGSPSDTATLGVDYTDASTTPGTVTFGAGEWVKTIQISIDNDTEIEDPESFQVALTGAGSVHPTATTVTINDNDSDDTPPKSWFHHPRHGFTYRYGDYRLREMHVFFSDQGGSEVVGVEMALRKNKLDGSCAWWYKGRWAAGSCSSKRWLSMQLDFDLYLRRFPALKPSVGTPIKNYTAWCRATDGAGNLQATFLHDRQGTQAKGDGNWSTFEVKRA